MKRSMLIFVAFTNIVLAAVQAAPLSTGFTYQGRLTDNGQLANGTYDFQFKLFDGPTNGAQVPVVLGYPTVAVSNGLFATGLDFGSNVFNGTTWWLEISLRPSGTFGEFIFLSPRQPLTPAPYALFAPNAGTATSANSVAASTVSALQLNTGGAPASGQVLAFDGTGLIWSNASNAAAAWSLNGNAGTAPDVNSIGTTDNQPLEIKVNGRRALRLEPNDGGPNVIGGNASNYVAAGVAGATIAGGGGQSNNNSVLANYGTIGGGNANSIKGGAAFSIIGGGTANLVDTNASIASVGGGQSNTAGNEGATVGGGNSNTAGAAYSTVGGGLRNTIQENAYLAIIAGGEANTIQSRADEATISGGDQNTIKNGASHAFIGGGGGNTIGTNAIAAVTVGGLQNTAAGRTSFAAGYGAKALHDGAFVWCDLLEGVPPNFPSAATNEFAVRATGGVRIVSGVDFLGTPLAGATLPAGSGSWTTLSDRNAKTNFALVDSHELLERLARLPIQTWSYKSQPVSTRHIGPVAQDFHASFNVGEDNFHIATVDADGVALAAIQALNDIVKEKGARILELEKRNSRLENRLVALETLVTDLGRKENASQSSHQIK